jgi:hypothetical protein
MRVIQKAYWCGVGLTLFSLTLTGCWSKVEKQPKKHKEDFGLAPAPKNRAMPGSEKSLDFTGLRGVLAGKWELKEEQEYTAKPTLDFTEGTTVFLKRYGSEKVAKYDFKDGVLTITTEWDGMRRAGATLKPKTKEQKEQAPNEYVYGVEFLSDGVISLRLDRSGDGFDWFQLAGQWRRISLPPSKQSPVLGTGPIADAKRQVQNIEAKLAKNEAVLKSALADRDDLVAKLRDLGVNSSADLKGNIRAQRVAENLAKLTNEVEGLERYLGVIDSELLKAKSIVRRLEQEQAGLSEEEMRTLATQLREVEERTDGTPLPVTPLDVDAAVEKALKGSTTSKKSK